jgi:hypothetical protein
MSIVKKAVTVNVGCILGVILVGVLRPDANLYVFLSASILAIVVVNVAVFRPQRKDGAHSATGKLPGLPLILIGLVLFALSILFGWLVRSGKV